MSGSLELGRQARALVRATDRAGLATAMKNDGWPYASLVMIACDAGGAPLLLISELAEHTQNILADNRVALLIDGTACLENPLAGTRVTLTGRVQKTTGNNDVSRYIRRHPDAALYAEFKDFSLYRLVADRAHMVAGFGNIHWIESADYKFDTAFAENLMSAEAEIVAHMNEDHSDAVRLYANNLIGLSGQDWTMTGIDPEGLDLRNGGTVARLAFDTPVGTAAEARKALVALAAEGRKIG